MAPSDAQQLQVDCSSYGYQPFARDTIFNKGRARDMVNSSLGDPTVIALNKERRMETHCSPDYKWTQRVRIVELEKEFT
jgi:hypothetical protein